MIIKARFIGKDSLGYQFGKEYILLTEDLTSIKRSDGSGVCPYNSIRSFLNNWTDIQGIIK
jgi:hypothetical protein